MPRLLLGIDIGTTATKGIILEPDSGIIAKAETRSMLRSPHSGWAEEDPRQWWDNVAVVTRKCLGDACARPEEIAAVGVSGMVPTLILLDAEGRVLRASIQQNDARSYREIDDFLQRVSNEELLERTGSAVTQQSIGPKLLWLRRHEPDVMARAAHLMGSYDYIVYRLTGERSCERNWALESGLFDLGREVWDPVLLELSTIAENLLGRVCWASEVVGRVTRDAADFTGLAEGTVVVAGSADHIASAFSAGLNSPGELDYTALDNGAANLPPGSDGLVLLPYFLGEKTPINDPLARGVFFGLDLRLTRAHLYRAVLEGIAYGFLHHLEVMAERGLKASRARVTNGGTRSVLWKQITSDVLGLPLEQVADHPGSSLGAAFVAGKGAGVFKNWSDIERFISVGETVEANLAAHERYQEFFGVYREIYATLKDTFPALLKATGRNCERCD